MTEQADRGGPLRDSHRVALHTKERRVLLSGIRLAMHAVATKGDGIPDARRWKHTIFYHEKEHRLDREVFGYRGEFGTLDVSMDAKRLAVSIFPSYFNGRAPTLTIAEAHLPEDARAGMDAVLDRLARWEAIARMQDPGTKDVQIERLVRNEYFVRSRDGNQAYANMLAGLLHAQDAPNTPSEIHLNIPSPYRPASISAKGSSTIVSPTGGSRAQMLLDICAKIPLPAFPAVRVRADYRNWKEREKTRAIYDLSAPILLQIPTFDDVSALRALSVPETAAAWECLRSPS